MLSRFMSLIALSSFDYHIVSFHLLYYLNWTVFSKHSVGVFLALTMMFQILTFSPREKLLWILENGLFFWWHVFIMLCCFLIFLPALWFFSVGNRFFTLLQWKIGFLDKTWHWLHRRINMCAAIFPLKFNSQPIIWKIIRLIYMPIPYICNILLRSSLPQLFWGFVL